MQRIQSLSSRTLFLHWAVAISTIFLLASGLIMIGKYFDFYPIHKTLGVLALLLIVSRILWRLKQGWPLPISRQEANFQRVAKCVHSALLLGSLLMPLSGMLASGMSGNGFGFLELWYLVPRNPSPDNPELVIPFSEFWMNVGYDLHTWVGYTMVALIVLHALAALKHHFIDKDATLLRMLGITPRTGS